MSGFPAPSGERAIVLVHGAWVGEWSWLPILPALQASGRLVHAVSLTGHGSRSADSGPWVDLTTHVADVVSVIESLDLRNITLVGHSYGGRIITRVGHELADRITSMVYLDAHAPLDGDPGQSTERARVADENDGMLPFSIYRPTPTAELMGDLEWFLARVMPQSYACFVEEWRHPIPDGVAPTFVFATANEASRFEGYARSAEQDPGWRYHELPGSHFLMLDHPDEVAAIVLDA